MVQFSLLLLLLLLLPPLLLAGLPEGLLASGPWVLPAACYLLITT